MSEERVRDSGFDDFLDAVEEGEPFYLESPSGNGWLPPRTFDPETGESGLTEEPLQDTGEILTYTMVNVSGPSMADDTPYTVAVAQFGPVRITGMIPDAENTDVDIGDEVTFSVGETETSGDRILLFEKV